MKIKIKHGLARFLPKRKVIIDVESGAERDLMDAAVKCGCFCSLISKTTDISTFCIDEGFERTAKNLLVARGRSYEKRKNRLYGYRSRIGIAVGVALFFVLLFSLSGILWSIDVTGNEALTDEEIKNMLADCGVSEGMFIKRIDNEQTRIKMMNRYKDIAWISVNVKGMTAEVVIAEAERKPIKDEELKYSHVVASCDGIITAITVERGQSLVKLGETVRKGELLVSGIIEERDGDISLVSAKANVYAQTEHTVVEKSPYYKVIKTGYDKTMSEIRIQIFGKSIIFSRKYGLNVDECDIIHKRGSISLFEGFRLPVSYVATYVGRSAETTVSVSRDEALRAAEAAVYERLFSSYDVQLISRRISAEFCDDGVNVTLHAVCEENISEVMPFTAEP